MIGCIYIFIYGLYGDNGKANGSYCQLDSLKPIRCCFEVAGGGTCVATPSKERG